jgi:hypothetical protein
MMSINKEKSIGRVLFIVEGGRTEFSLLRRIFCNVLGYEYIEKRRGKAKFFKSKNISTSKVAVINTQQSHITYVLDKNDYLDDIFATLITEYSFPVDRAAIYYLFDRDPESNRDSEFITQLILSLRDPYENEDFRGGLLLLSYPSIESYSISSFEKDSYKIEISLGNEAKHFIAANNHIQINKIDEKTIVRAADELIKYMENEGIKFELDDFSKTNRKIFDKQERLYYEKAKYKVLSLLSIAFMQLGIIDFE